MALCTSCGVLLLLATLNVALAVPAGSSYSVEENIPAGSRFGITAPLGSSGERVVVQAKDDEGDAAGNPTKAEKSAAETNSSTTATPSDSSVTTSAAPAPAPAAPVPSIVAASVTSTSSSTSAVTSRQAAEPRRAKVVLVGSAPGELILDQSAPGEPVTITGAISGLTPGKHGFHIHVYGDTGDSCAAAGGHFNPAQAKHGAPSASVRHVGDLGNIVADDQGIAAVDIQDPLASLYDGANNVVGRGVVVHANEDDLGLGGDDGSMATGNAGGRVSCGVIGLAGPAKKKN